MRLYVVEALRWGDRENHSYVVGVYSDIPRAERAAKVEELYRGGKYECVISQFVKGAIDSTKEKFFECDLPEDDSDFTAILENWYVEKVDHKSQEYIIWGKVYGDTKQRFKDGTVIHTSGIPIHQVPRKGTIIDTRNSRYFLGTPLQDILSGEA